MSQKSGYRWNRPPAKRNITVAHKRNLYSLTTNHYTASDSGQKRAPFPDVRCYFRQHTTTQAHTQYTHTHTHTHTQHTQTIHTHTHTHIHTHNTHKQFTHTHTHTPHNTHITQTHHTTHTGHSPIVVVSVFQDFTATSNWRKHWQPK